MKDRGFTILELLVSIVILSIVLTFAMNLFIKVRSAYSQEKANIVMEISKSIIIDAVMSDVNNFTVNRVSCNQNSVSIAYGGSNLIIKRLVFDTTKEDYDYIKYTNEVNTVSIVRKLPKGSLVGPVSCTSKVDASVGTINHIYYLIKDKNGKDYSLDLFIVS